MSDKPAAHSGSEHPTLRRELTQARDERREETEQIRGPCSLCGDEEHWRPDCPIMAWAHKLTDLSRHGTGPDRVAFGETCVRYFMEQKRALNGQLAQLEAELAEERNEPGHAED